MDVTKKDNSEDFKITGDWDKKAKELKIKFSHLTDTDLKFDFGKESELLTRLETKLKIKRDEIIDLIKETLEF